MARYWSGHADKYALLAELGDDELMVYVHGDGCAWKGRLESDAGEGCAATRGDAAATRAFKYVCAGCCDAARTRVEVSDSGGTLIVEAGWGVDVGVRGLYVAIARISLSSIAPAEFLRMLFGRIGAARKRETETSACIRGLHTTVNELRCTHEALTRAAPVLRHRKTVAVTRALNEYKRCLSERKEQCPEQQITQ